MRCGAYQSWCPSRPQSDWDTNYPNVMRTSSAKRLRTAPRVSGRGTVSDLVAEQRRFGRVRRKQTRTCATGRESRDNFADVQLRC